MVWRWGTSYDVSYVNKLRSMLARHLAADHQLYCITDDLAGLDPGIVPVMMWDPGDLKRARRLRMFGGVAGLFGDRILHMDIDVVITRDITHLVMRHEPFVIWRCPASHRFKGNLTLGAGSHETGVLCSNDVSELSPYNTSLILRDSNTLSNLWTEYVADPEAVEKRAQKAQLWTTIMRKSPGETEWRVTRLDPRDDDQAVVSLYAMPLDPPVWGEEDGIYKWGRRGFADKAKLPDNAAVVFMNGSLRVNRIGLDDYPWLKEHWR